ncbi:MAG: hypothetical protein Kow00105_05990 [Phycisphaeraceae bacterium]
MPKVVIPSKLTELPAVEQAVLDLARQHGFGQEELFAIRLALDEAVTNAIVHGNQNDETKNVSIEYDVHDDAMCITVQDEGCGFCPDDLPDPTLPENLTSPHGRGVMLIESYMTEVSYNDCGNCLRMVKRKGCKRPKA